MKVQIINGPNLNLLGEREKEIYGALSLAEIKKHTQQMLEDRNIELSWWQSNIEGEIINKIHDLSRNGFEALIINPAGYSHTSVAILDALSTLKIPIVEVHLTNVYQRESFRHSLLTAKAASIIMGGLGKDAYYYASLALLRDQK